MEERRRERMARLRAENEAEETRMTPGSSGGSSTIKHKGGDYFTTTKNGDYTTNSSSQEDSSRAKQEFLSVQSSELEELDEEEQMKLLFGFSGGFDSTKNKAVKDNASSASRGAASKNKQRKYRQYMNRKGGFNRPLDKMT
mmetsp:Transcript_34658/g.45935  ORF Transcript_34658/g.45935 Transcript_34658/m.45935 type:complete len:141 (+) Transcript_34658:573-995(+)